MKPLIVTLLASALVAIGCGGSDDAAALATAGSEGKATAGAERPGDGEDGGAAAADTHAAGSDPAGPGARRGPRLKLRDSQLGPVLFDGRDRALYTFTRDPKRRTRCYGSCAEAWPPFYAKEGRPRAGRGVESSLLGTVRRRDGRRQVTYKGRPLYFYVHDPKGEVLCNDVVEFGGTWYAVDAKGDPPA